MSYYGSWVVANVLNVLKVAFPVTLAEFFCYFPKNVSWSKVGHYVYDKKTQFGGHGSKPVECISLANYLTTQVTNNRPSTTFSLSLPRSLPQCQTLKFNYGYYKLLQCRHDPGSFPSHSTCMTPFLPHTFLGLRMTFYLKTSLLSYLENPIMTA
jgi:hypothetical protein